MGCRLLVYAAFLWLQPSAFTRYEATISITDSKTSNQERPRRFSVADSCNSSARWPRTAPKSHFVGRRDR